MTDQSSRPQQPGVQRDPIVGAFMALLAEKRFEDIGFAEIARRAGVSLSELRGKHTSKIEMLAAHMREVDRAVLDGIDAGHGRRAAARAAVRRADAPPRHAGAAQGGGAIAATLGDVQSRPHAGGQRPCGALHAMDADRRRHFGDGTEGHGARAGARHAVRIGAAHLGR